MKRILVIGDTHFDEKYRDDYLTTQIKCIQKLVVEHQPNAVIFLGDISDKRKPKPPVLLAIQELFHFIKSEGVESYVLRGNHDSNSKSDDGVTYLSLYNELVYTIVHTDRVNIFGKHFTFIPHYENQQRIIEYLSKVPDKDVCIGHFGFRGCINSIGDYDFNIDINAFNNFTILGHIHKYSQEGLISVLGTPYPTSFQESDYKPVVGIIEINGSNWTYDVKPVNHGIRYYTFKLNEIEKYRKKLLNTDTYNIVRVYVNPDSNETEVELRNKLIEEFNIAWVDIKVLSEEVELNTVYTGAIPKFDETILEDYLSKLDSIPYSKKEVMEVFNSLKENNDT